MATKVEQLRIAATEAKNAFSSELAKYDDDNLPNAEQEANLATLRTAMVGAVQAAQGADSFSEMRETWNAQASATNLARRNKGDGNPLYDPRDARGGRELLTVGRGFVENPTYKEWLATVTRGSDGGIPEKVRLQSPQIEFAGGLKALDRQATVITGASDTSAGAFVVNDVYPNLTELGRRPLTLRQVITNLQTGSDTVEYVRITTETNNAAPVAEATATSGGSGQKPESALVFEKVTTVVKTIAHWIPATRRALSDASQIRGLIDAFLKYGLEEELEDQIANGDGTGENFTGILNTSGTQAQAWDTDLFVTARIAKRKVATVGRRRPNAYILNPEDWERVELSKDNQNRFYGAGPFGDTAPRLWGLPVVESEAVPAGTGLVGDFSTCVLWDRESASLAVSDSHSDFFTRNLIAILAEMRAAFGILKPNAIVEIDLTA